MTKKKIVPLVLILVGVAFLLGAIISWFDNLTASEPVGLGKWIFDIFVALIGASSGIKGWLDWNKKENPPQVTKITANDNAQVATGDHGRNIRQGDNSQYIENFHEASKPEKIFSPIHQLPPSPADFTGREEIIKELLKDFESHKGATISGLTGMGGIGKTVLGLVVAHRIEEQYPDGQIMIDLKGTTAPVSALDAIRQIVLLLEPQKDVRTLDESNMVAFYLSILDGKKILLFLDNARSAEQIAPLRPPATCAMLVTSRWNFAVAGLKTHKVGVLSEQQAIDFLLELCPRTSEKVAELAKSCAYLPLALRIAGSFLSVNTNWRVDKYLEELRNINGRLAILVKSRTDADLTAEPDLLATFELSYNQLKEEEKRHWHILGVFPTSFPSYSAAAMWDTRDNDARNLLAVFTRYSLVDYNEITSRYELHDLLAEYAQSKMDNEEEGEARLKYVSHYKDVLSLADYLYKKGGENILQGLRLVDLEWKHIQLAHSWIVEHVEDSEQVTKLAMLYPLTGAYCLDLRLHPRQKIVWIQQALIAAQKLVDNDSESTLLGNLGNTYLALGDYQSAMDYLQKALKIVREIGYREGEGTIYDSLGVAYSVAGDERKAIEYYELAEKIAEEIGDKRNQAVHLGNIGNAYFHFDDVRRAVVYYNRSLQISRDIGDRRSESTSLHCIGSAYRALGDAQKAIDFYNQALVIDREISDRHGEATGLCDLGWVYAALGDYRKAIGFYDQALIINREVEDRRGEGNILSNLGLAFAEMGESLQAIEMFDQALVIDREVGDRHGEGVNLGNLGSAYYFVGKKKKGIEFMKQALEIFEALKSPEAIRAHGILQEMEKLGEGER